MLPYIHVVIPLYGVLAAVGFVAAVVIFLFRAKGLSLSTVRKFQIAEFAAVGIFAGSRFVFVLTMLPSLFKDFSWVKLFNIVVNGGLVFYGGLLGAILGVFLYVKWRRLDMHEIFNIVTPCFPLFHGFGRIGCFLSGCCYGIPWAYGVAMASDPDVPRFPVQLAEATGCFIIFAIMLIIERKRPHSDLLSLYLICYAPLRFGLEFLRGDTVRGVWGIFSTSQWISLVILIIVVIRFVKKNYHIKKV